jgi:hypothetical protein
MKLPTARGYFSGDKRRNEQRRLGPFFALCLDQRWGGEPVYCFDLGAEAMLAMSNQQINDGSTVLASRHRADLGGNSGGLL